MLKRKKKASASESRRLQSLAVMKRDHEVEVLEKAERWWASMACCFGLERRQTAERELFSILEKWRVVRHAPSVEHIKTHLKKSR